MHDCECAVYINCVVFDSIQWLLRCGYGFFFSLAAVFNIFACIRHFAWKYHTKKRAATAKNIFKKKLRIIQEWRSKGTTTTNMKSLIDYCSVYADTFIFMYIPMCIYVYTHGIVFRVIHLCASAIISVCDTIPFVCISINYANVCVCVCVLLPLLLYVLLLLPLIIMRLYCSSMFHKNSMNIIIILSMSRSHIHLTLVALFLIYFIFVCFFNKSIVIGVFSVLYIYNYIYIYCYKLEHIRAFQIIFNITIILWLIVCSYNINETKHVRQFFLVFGCVSVCLLRFLEITRNSLYACFFSALPPRFISIFQIKRIPRISFKNSEREREREREKSKWKYIERVKFSSRCTDS